MRRHNCREGHGNRDGSKTGGNPGEKRKGLREPGMGPRPRNRNSRVSRMRMARDEE